MKKRLLIPILAIALASVLIAGGVLAANFWTPTNITSEGGSIIVTTIGTAPSLSNISLTPSYQDFPNIEVGYSKQFTALGIYSDGSRADITAIVIWSSSTDNASISKTGLVVGVSAGTSEITASLSGVNSSHIDLNVQPDYQTSGTATWKSVNASSGSVITVTGHIDFVTNHTPDQTINGWTVSNIVAPAGLTITSLTASAVLPPNTGGITINLLLIGTVTIQSGTIDLSKLTFTITPQ